MESQEKSNNLRTEKHLKVDHKVAAHFEQMSEEGVNPIFVVYTSNNNPEEIQMLINGVSEDQLVETLAYLFVLHSFEQKLSFDQMIEQIQKVIADI